MRTTLGSPRHHCVTRAPHILQNKVLFGNVTYIYIMLYIHVIFHVIYVMYNALFIYVCVIYINIHKTTNVAVDALRHCYKNIGFQLWEIFCWAWTTNKSILVFETLQSRVQHTTGKFEKGLTYKFLKLFPSGRDIKISPLEKFKYRVRPRYFCGPRIIRWFETTLDNMNMIE